ncbi:MAG: 30S ribosomal protein S11 [Lentisphaerae bacterium]|nr:30S ribosomal protein S11 [Lentisphaerota bacterium]
MADEQKQDRNSQESSHEAEKVQQETPVIKPEATQASVEQPLDEATETSTAKSRGRTRGSKNIYNGIVNILATFNNTIVSITDTSGSVIAWSNGGRMGFKGARKSTAFAATTIAQDAARQAMAHGMREVEIRVQGPGSGRESAIRAIQAAGLNITVISDVTPIPHNGCRPRKRRRV